MTERLIPSSTTALTSSDEADFDKIPQLLEPENAPAYILVKLDNAGSQETQWLLATYVPDNAQVRLKMLYSSTKATLSRQLGDGKFLHTMFASTRVRRDGLRLTLADLRNQDELSAAGFKRFFAHQTSSGTGGCAIQVTKLNLRVDSSLDGPRKGDGRHPHGGGRRNPDCRDISAANSCWCSTRHGLVRRS